MFNNITRDDEFNDLKFNKNDTKIFSYIKPRIQKLSKLAPNLNDYHIMIPIGWKNGFEAAGNIYDKIEELMKNLKAVGDNNGYSTEVRYSTLHYYFSKLKDMNLKYPVFKNNFDPSNGLNENNRASRIEPAVGSYSQDINFKSKVRKLYNSIMAMKVLFTARLMRATDNEIKMQGRHFRDGEKTCRHQISFATELYSTLLSYDSISGIHTNDATSIQTQTLINANNALLRCK